MDQLAEPVVSFVLGRISDLLIEEAKFLQGVNEQAKQFEDELRLMRKLLKDVDSKRDESDRVREWISQCKDLAYEAENVLETYAFGLESRRGGGGIVDVLKRYACILNQCYMRHKMGTEIKNLKNRVSKITADFQKYGIQAETERAGPSSSASSRLQELRRTYSHVVDDDFVGLGGDVEMLAQKLVTENELRVVSISGMGGLGKTTIARKVYNHPDVKHHFDGFAWVWVSQQWQKIELLQGMLKKLMPERTLEIERWNDDDLIRQLFQLLQRRRCLIVIDDIWKIEAWECIKYGFPVRETGSKILLTTRQKDVAIKINPYGFHHEPRILDDDESWELLQKKSLRKQEAPDFQDAHALEKLGREMVKSCKGLPLAVEVLGGILAAKQSYNEWRKVYKNVRSYLGREEIIGISDGEVQSILALSYDELPYKLKPCFLYLSMFYEDEVIEADTLYANWLAEGMVPLEDRLTKGESMMDVAERYLGELAKRCMVQLVEAGEDNVAMEVNRFKQCRIHDLMRDVCLHKAKQENFSEMLDFRHYTGDIDPHQLIESSHKIPRLTIQMGEKDMSNYSISPKMETVYLNVRSLRFSILDEKGTKVMDATSQIKNFKMLRALTVEGIRFIGNENRTKRPPKVVGNLLHLRYLCLKKCIFLTMPLSIGTLEHLEILDLRSCVLLVMPNIFKKMKRLRHLYLIAPEDLSIRIHESNLKLDSFVKLETFENLSDQVFDCKDIQKLVNLRVLSASINKYENLEAMINYIESNSSSCLQDVTLKVHAFEFNSGSTPDKATSLVKKLLLCKGCLSRLELWGPFGRIPELGPGLSQNLVQLSMHYSAIEEDPMGALEKLPNLQVLCFYEKSYKGTEMVCHAMGFLKLKILVLLWLDNLKKLRVDREAMPNLHRLEIGYCKGLETVPEGLRFLASIKELVIEGMAEEFVKRLKEDLGQEGRDSVKVRSIPSRTLL